MYLAQALRFAAIERGCSTLCWSCENFPLVYRTMNKDGSINDAVYDNLADAATSVGKGGMVVLTERYKNERRIMAWPILHDVEVEIDLFGFGLGDMEVWYKKTGDNGEWVDMFAMRKSIKNAGISHVR